MIKEDHCVYVKWSKGNFLILFLYVDDILFSWKWQEDIITQGWWPSKFEMEDIGEASYVLKFMILRGRSRRLLGLSQKTYIK